jgi:hypothetical protein
MLEKSSSFCARRKVDAEMLENMVVVLELRLNVVSPRTVVNTTTQSGWPTRDTSQRIVDTQGWLGATWMSLIASRCASILFIVQAQWQEEQRQEEEVLFRNFGMWNEVFLLWRGFIYSKEVFLRLLVSSLCYRSIAYTAASTDLHG